MMCQHKQELMQPNMLLTCGRLHTCTHWRHEPKSSQAGFTPPRTDVSVSMLATLGSGRRLTSRHSPHSISQQLSGGPPVAAKGCALSSMVDSCGDGEGIHNAGLVLEGLQGAVVGPPQERVHSHAHLHTSCMFDLWSLGPDKLSHCRSAANRVPALGSEDSQHQGSRARPE